MVLILSETQIILRETIQRLMADSGGVAPFRALRDTADSIGFSTKQWQRLVSLGLTGILVPEENGGLELGHVEAGIVLEELGRALDPSPFLTTAVGAVAALRLAPEELRERWLPSLAAGEVIAAIAIDESVVHRPSQISLNADCGPDGYVLAGTKTFVRHGHVAGLLIVVARSDQAGIQVFALPRNTQGISWSVERLVDGGFYADMTFADVKVDKGSLIGGPEVFGAMLDVLGLGAAAEQLGIASEAADRTVLYLKERRQFGVPIGSFQALQHRAAALYCEIEVARSAVLKAQQLLDASSPEATVAISVAKSMTDYAATLAVQEGVQMHGGVGMTDEYDIGLFMKRAKVLSREYGSADFHAAHLADLEGY